MSSSDRGPFTFEEIIEFAADAEVDGLHELARILRETAVEVKAAHPDLGTRRLGDLIFWTLFLLWPFKRPK